MHLAYAPPSIAAFNVQLYRLKAKLRFLFFPSIFYPPLPPSNLRVRFAPSLEAHLGGGPLLQ